MEYSSRCWRPCCSFDSYWLTLTRMLSATGDGVFGNVADALHDEQRADLPPSPGHTRPDTLKHTPRSAKLSGACATWRGSGFWQELEPKASTSGRDAPVPASPPHNRYEARSSGTLGRRWLIDRESGEAHADIGMHVVGRIQDPDVRHCLQVPEQPAPDLLAALQLAAPFLRWHIQLIPADEIAVLQKD